MRMETVPVPSIGRRMAGTGTPFRSYAPTTVLRLVAARPWRSVQSFSLWNGEPVPGLAPFPPRREEKPVVGRTPPRVHDADHGNANGNGACPFHRTSYGRDRHPVPLCAPNHGTAPGCGHPWPSVQSFSLWNGEPVPGRAPFPQGREEKPAHWLDGTESVRTWIWQ